MRIPVARPWLGVEEETAAGRVIRSGWVTQGPEIAAFEQEFAQLAGAPHACAVSSCTTALHLALRAVGVGPGDEVITASFSYIATANAIRHCGAIPVFVDIEEKGPNIDPSLIEASIGPATRAILCVHQIGIPCDVERIAKIASSHSLPLIEDAACAIGSGVRGANGFERIGRPHGDIACFSFHPRKLLTTGDGGMLTTRNDGFDRRFRIERQHGMDVSDLTRHSRALVVDEKHGTIGYNYRMTDVQAAIGRVQLTRLPAILERRRNLARRYAVLLENVPVVLPGISDCTNVQSFMIELPDGCDRRRLMQKLLDKGIATRRGVHCAHREPAYQTEPWKMGAGGLARSERAQDRSLVLPLFHDMTEEQQDEVASGLRLALETERRAHAS